MERRSGITKIIVLSLEANVPTKYSRYDLGAKLSPCSLPKRTKNRIWEASRAALEASWAVWEASWAVLEASWGVLGLSWRVLAASWDVLDASWTVLEAS